MAIADLQAPLEMIFLPGAERRLGKGRWTLSEECESGEQRAEQRRHVVP